MRQHPINRHAPPRCPACGSTNLVHDELITGERGWRCRECGHEWVHEELRPDISPPAE
jgi:transposase-like protein